MDSKKTIWIINQYAKKDGGRHSEFARSFFAQGYNVIVFVSSFSHGSKKYLYDEDVKIVDDNGIKYVYLRSTPPYLANGIKRILNMLDFCRLFRHKYKKIAGLLGHPNYIIASSVHPFVWEIGFSAAKKYHSRFIAEVRDIWPLSLIEVNHMSPYHPLVILFKVIEKRAYRRANAVVTTMPYAYKHVCKVANIPKDKVFWIPNGLRTSSFNEALKSGGLLPTHLDDYLTNHWCAIYTGSFVPSECVTLLIEAMARLRDTDIHLAIVGHGQEEERYRELINDLNLRNVEIFPYISPDLVPIALSKANCCVAAIHSYPIYRYGLSLNKLSEYLYSGKPVLFACNVKNAVEEAGQFVVPSEDPDKYANELRKIRCISKENLGEVSNTNKLFIFKNYDYERLADEYLSLMNSI